MKSDTERKLFHYEPLHRRKNRLHVHLSKELRAKLKTKKRAILVHKNDKVKLLRGTDAGKDAKVVRVDTNRRKLFLEGIVVKNARGKEILLPVDPSNTILIGLEETAGRKKLFSEDVFKKETPKPEKKEPKETETETAKSTETKTVSPKPEPSKHDAHSQASHKHDPTESHTQM